MTGADPDGLAEHPSRASDRPLDPVGSIKIKIGLLVALSILAAALVLQVGTRAGVPAWLTLPVTLAAALGVTQWLARGMTAPLREMTSATGRMARGDYSSRVTATSADEVGNLGRAFNTMAQDLATADQQRRQLVATVSHELRTPLAGQRALLENLVDGVVRPDDAALHAALAQSERLSDLVEDLLEVSRVDGGAVRLALEPVPVAELLQASVAESALGARPVRYEVSVTPPDLEVEADAARLHQVVSNLLDNASRHSPVAGLVRVRAHRTLEEDHWVLEVADEGPGIPPDRAATLFTRFGTTDSTSGGTGLGLAIANWVAQLHGGTISAVRPPAGETGARLRVVLPLHPRPPASQPNVTPQEGISVSDATPTKPEVSSAGGSGQATATVATETPPGAESAGALIAATNSSSGSVVEQLFGGLWPERASLRTAPVALFASLAVGLVGALVLPDRYFGIGTFLVLLLAGALVLSLSVHRSRWWTIASAALCVGLGALVFLRAAEWLAVLALLVAAVLVTTALTDARRPLSMVAGGVAWVLSAIRGLPLLGRTLTATSRHQVLWPVLRTVAISLVLLVVFVGLFASGDAVFGSWVSGILPEVSIADSLVLRAFTWFLVAGVVLAGCYLALNPPRVDRVGLGEPRPVARAWEWQVPVGVVVATFALFLVAQATAMWGGHDYLQRTTGLTYAEYVHEGFGQLVVATILTLLTIAVAVRKAPRETARDRLVLRVLLGALCVGTLAIVASALYRMSLYQEAYGYTVLRILVDGFELWLGVVVVMVIIAGVRLSGAWLPRAVVLSGAVFLLVFGLINPEGWVAQQNIDRFEATGKLDLDYLASLGPDAVPTIVNGLPEDLERCIVTRPDSVQGDDLLEWNAGRSRASDAELSRFSLGEPGCPQTIGE